MTELLATWGPAGLALAAFLAGSIVPAPSEAVLALLLHQGQSPAPLVVLATVANTAGAATLLWLGRQGRAVAERHTRPERLARFEAAYRRAGAPVLLGSWVPIVGDAVVLAAGVARLRVGVALLWIGAGKLGRYAAVAWLLS